VVAKKDLRMHPSKVPEPPKKKSLSRLDEKRGGDGGGGGEKTQGRETFWGGKLTSRWYNPTCRQHVLGGKKSLLGTRNRMVKKKSPSIQNFEFTGRKA